MRLNEGHASREAQATRQVLAYVLEQSLRLLHPFMPFVTETIWQNLPGMAGDANRSIMATRWPQLEWAMRTQRRMMPLVASRRLCAAFATCAANMTCPRRDASPRTSAPANIRN